MMRPNVSKLLTPLFGIILVIFVGLLQPTQGIAQNSEIIDSLRQLIDETKVDSTRANLLYQLGRANRRVDTAAQLAAHLEAAGLFDTVIYQSNQVDNLVQIATCYFSLGHLNKAEEVYLEARDIALKNNDLDGEVWALEVYLDRFININDAVYSLELIYELQNRVRNSGDQRLEFKVYGLINEQYLLLGTRQDSRRQNADTMLAIAQEMGDTSMLRMAYFNLAVSSDGQEAIDFYVVSLRYTDRQRDHNYLSAIYNNLSGKFEVIGYFQIAADYADSAYIISREIGREEGMAAARYRKARAYFRMNKFRESIDLGKEALQIFKDADILRRQNICAEVIAAGYEELGDFEQALFYRDLKEALKDSLEKKSQAREAEFVDRKFNYELKKRQDSIAFQQERAIADLELQNLNNERSKDRLKLYLMYGGAGMALILAIIMWIGFVRKRRDNEIIEQQKLIVEEKNREITDSINYARRIQSAILPPGKIVKEYLKDSFILYKPKDIVAGDFYWFEHKDNTILFAAADCTGHGVPGAMVSVICNNGLNRSVREYGLSDPGQILDKTREIVEQEFRAGQAGEQFEDEVKDGMDIALCALEGSVLRYAGAHNPLWIIRNGELLETKADKQPIGQFDQPTPFTTHTIELQPGDAIYIFSDGYADQFGGEKGKKFKVKSFRNLLLSIYTEPMEKQRETLNNTFEEWQGDIEQVDDVCVIGVKV